MQLKQQKNGLMGKGWLKGSSNPPKPSISMSHKKGNEMSTVMK
jgi:hypothetical protein